MDYRSSTGGQHISGDINAGIGSSHGVQLSGGSTGGLVQAIGDDANITLRLKGKGTGGVVIGDSSQTLTVQTLAVGSGVTIRGAFTSTFTYELGAVSSGQVGLITVASTTFDVNPGDLIGAIEVTPTTNVLTYAGYRLSTAATSRLTVIMANVSSTATSTTSGQIRLTWLDLTA
jgi:hypothetical protein